MIEGRKKSWPQQHHVHLRQIDALGFAQGELIRPITSRLSSRLRGWRATDRYAPSIRRSGV